MPDEYNLPLGLDIQRVIQQAGQVRNILSDLNTQAQNVGRNTQAAFSATSGAATNMGRTVVQQASAFGTTTRSIENMKDALNDLKMMAFSETDTAKIRHYNQEIQKLETQIRRTSNIGRDGFDEMGNRIQNAEKKTSSFMNVLVKVATVLTAAFAVNKLIDYGKEILSVTQKLEGVERAFNRINAPGLLDELRKSTRGAVSDLELMQRAVLANQFGIPIKNLATFYEFAAKRARDLGVDTDKFVNDVISGTARGSVRILDNLGLSQNEVRAEVKKTGDFATAVFNIIQKQQLQAQKDADTTGDKIGKISATITNIEGNIGKSSTGIISTIADLIQSQLNLIDGYVQGVDARLKDIGTKLSTQDNSKLIAAFKNDTQAGRDSAIKGYTKNIQDQEKALMNLDKELAKVNAGLGAEGVDPAVIQKKRDDQLIFVSELKGELESLRGVQDDEANQKKREAEALENGRKAREARDKAIVTESKALNDKLTALTNDYNNSQLAAIEDTVTKQVATETVNSQNRVRTLQAEKKDLQAQSAQYPELAKEFQKTIKQINNNIAEEQTQSVSRVALIIKMGEEEKVKQTKASQQEIARVLKTSYEAQIEDINSRYDLIRQNAKKAGTLTNEVEKKLAEQQGKDVSDVTIKFQDEALKKQEDLALSGIYIRKKRESQNEKQFEIQNQTDLLKIQVEFDQKRLALIAGDPSKVKEANDLRKAIQDAENQLNKLKSEQKGDLFDTLGLDPEKVKQFSSAISEVGSLASGLFGALADQAQARVDAVQKQIDAIDSLVSAQQDAVDKEKDLMDKGFANNYSNAQKTLNATKAQRAALLKEQQAAQKEQQDLQRAQIVADGIGQVSNLITASTEIFKTFSVIPFIGIPLAIAAIASMFGAFAIAKVTAFNAVGSNDKFAEGGTIGGRSHSEGGNRYVSMDGNGGVSFMEHERGEEITKRSSAEKHRKLLKAINADDFSTLNYNDVSLQELLRGSGVHQHMEIAKEASLQNIAIVEKSNTVVVNGSSKSEGYLKSMNERLANIEKQNKEQPVVLDMGDFYVIKTGNYTQKVWKK